MECGSSATAFTSGGAGVLGGDVRLLCAAALFESKRQRRYRTPYRLTGGRAEVYAILKRCNVLSTDR